MNESLYLDTPPSHPSPRAYIVPRSDIHRWGMKIYESQHQHHQHSESLYQCMMHPMLNTYVYTFFTIYKWRDFDNDFDCNRFNELNFECRGSRSIASPQWMMAPKIMQFRPGKIRGNWFIKSQVPRQWLITKGEITKSDKKISQAFNKRFFHLGGSTDAKTLKLWYKT